MITLFFVLAVALGVWVGYRLSVANERVNAQIREARDYHPSRWNP